MTLLGTPSTPHSTPVPNKVLVKSGVPTASRLEVALCISDINKAFPSKTTSAHWIFTLFMIHLSIYFLLQLLLQSGSRGAAGLQFASLSQGHIGRQTTNRTQTYGKIGVPDLPHVSLDCGTKLKRTHTEIAVHTDRSWAHDLLADRQQDWPSNCVNHSFCLIQAV